MVAVTIPSTHVFEGMRAVLLENTYRADLMATALGLNVLYLAAGVGAFLRSFHVARVRGLLLQQGE